MVIRPTPNAKTAMRNQDLGDRKLETGFSDMS
jgi:hypothetical protein